MPIDDERLAKLSAELRRGVLILAVLAALQERHYGYSLRKRLAARHIDIDEGTLYPLLRRLEEQGLLQSEWEESEARKRRLYQISTDGQQALAQMKTDWEAINTAIASLFITEQPLEE